MYLVSCGLHIIQTCGITCTYNLCVKELIKYQQEHDTNEKLRKIYRDTAKFSLHFSKCKKKINGFHHFGLISQLIYIFLVMPFYCELKVVGYPSQRRGYSMNNILK